MSVSQRQRVEALITLTAARALLSAGYFLTVNDGEDDMLTRTRELGAVAASLMTTDTDIITATDMSDKLVGRVVFVYGNEGHDVISDYSLPLEEALKPALELAQSLEPGNRRTDIRDILDQTYKHMIAVTPAQIADELSELVDKLNEARRPVRAQAIGHILAPIEDKLRKVVERIRGEQS